MKINVKYKIWDVVNRSFWEWEYKVIWYNYIETQWLKYICLQKDKQDFLYFSEIELKWKEKKTLIWFVYNGPS